VPEYFRIGVKPLVPGSLSLHCCDWWLSKVASINRSCNHFCILPHGQSWQQAS
jgi:hypothetical protein